MSAFNTFNNIFNIFTYFALIASFINYLRTKPTLRIITRYVLISLSVLVLIAIISYLLSSSSFVQSIQSVQYYETAIIILLFIALAATSILLIRQSLNGETELVVTEQDITRERQAIDTHNSPILNRAIYARTIVVIREIIRLKDGRILDEERSEYDVYRTPEGREIRRLRGPITVPEF